MTLASAALTIAVLLIPGVAFIWGYERWNEVYARRARDWPFRLAAIAAVYLAVASGTIYWLASNYWTDLAKLKPVPEVARVCAIRIRRRCRRVRIRPWRTRAPARGVGSLADEIRVAQSGRTVACRLDTKRQGSTERLGVSVSQRV